MEKNFIISGSNIHQWRIQDFPKEGVPTPQGGHQHTILPNFPQNCMKLKEFGPPGAHVLLTPLLDPPMLLLGKKPKATTKVTLTSHPVVI